jgi:hypothetical protein
MRWAQIFRQKHGRNPTEADLIAELRKLGIEPKRDEYGKTYYTREQLEPLWRQYLDKPIK